MSCAGPCRTADLQRRTYAGPQPTTSAEPIREVGEMPRVTLEVSLEELKALILQLPVQEFLTLADSIQERVETLSMMQLSETAFREWGEAGEDIYDAKA